MSSGQSPLLNQKLLPAFVPGSFHNLLLLPLFFCHICLVAPFFYRPFATRTSHCSPFEIQSNRLHTSHDSRDSWSLQKNCSNWRLRLLGPSTQMTLQNVPHPLCGRCVAALLMTTGSDQRRLQGATRLPEFLIRITHADSSKVNLHLHIKSVFSPLPPVYEYPYRIHRFPKTYPRLACPIFTIEKPLQGLTNEHVTRLSHAIVGEAQKFKGSEMVFQVSRRGRKGRAVHADRKIFGDCQFCARVVEWECQTACRSCRIVGAADDPARDGRGEGESLHFSEITPANYPLRPGNNAKQMISNVNKNGQREKLKSCKLKSKKTPCASFWLGIGRNSKPAIGHFQSRRLYPLQEIH